MCNKSYYKILTFNLPNCGDHIPWQTTASHELVPIGQRNSGHIPNIKGYITFVSVLQGSESGDCIALTTDSGISGGLYAGSSIWNANGTGILRYRFDASTYSNFYRDEYDSVIPDYVIMWYCIKY